jgi:hypothetical protein
MTQAVPLPAPGSTTELSKIDLSMNVLFNGALYYVAEISDQLAGSRGFEVVNKRTGHGAFLDGAVADKMRTSFHLFMVERGGQATADEVEEFISDYDGLLMQRVVYH